MTTNESLRSEVTHHVILSNQLKEHYSEIDEETHRDTLEGISALPEAIATIVRSSLDDEAYMVGIKVRLD